MVTVLDHIYKQKVDYTFYIHTRNKGGGGDTRCGKWDYRGEKMWEVGL